jgi:hypothetical protein
MAAGGGLRVVREKAVSPAVPAAVATTAVPPTGRPKNDPRDRAAGSLAEPRPTLEAVVAAEGWNQLFQIVAWLPAATSVELDRVFQAWAAIPRFNFDASASRALFLRWMELDPSAAMAAAESKQAAQDTAWWAWAKTDPDAALSAVSESKTQGFIGAVLAAIAETDSARVATLLEEHPERRDYDVLGSLAGHAARTNLEAGVDLAWRGGALNDADRLLRAFAQENPEGALAWALTKARPGSRAIVLASLFDQLSLTHPEKVGPAIEALPPSRSRQHVFAEHAARLALDDPEAARAWAMRGATVEERTRALTAAARALTDHDPDAAVALLQSLESRPVMTNRLGINTPSGRQEVDYGNTSSLSEVMTELAAHRPAAVVEASLRLEETPERTRLLDTVFTTWARDDAPALSEWLIAQPESAIRTKATTSLVDALTEDSEPDFPAAVRWAATLPDEALLKGTLMIWQERDPEAPARALSSLGLPADRVPPLLEYLKLPTQRASSDPAPDP